MRKEIQSTLKKTVKIAGATCVAAGAIGILTSGVALKAICEGGKYLVNTVKRIANAQPQEAPEIEAAVSADRT